MTIWYQVDHPDYPHLANPMILATVPEGNRLLVIRQITAELAFILRCDVSQIKVWTESE